MPKGGHKWYPRPYQRPTVPTAQRSSFRSPLEDYQHTAEQTEFMMAMDRYKRENFRPFPTWSEVLEVLKALGYHK